MTGFQDGDSEPDEPRKPSPRPRPADGSPGGANPPRPPSDGRGGSRPGAGGAPDPQNPRHGRNTPRPGPAGTPSDNASDGLDDETMMLPTGNAASPASPGSEPQGLVPGPDETAILPPIDGESSAEPADSMAVKRHRDPSGGGDTVRKVVRGAGELLLTFGVIVMLFTAYEFWGVSAKVEGEQEDMAADLENIWQQQEEEGEDADPVPELGDAFARMWAPRIRPEPWVLVEGTDLADIEYAPGRYLDGAMPGQQGNFTLAGHNIPAIFQKIRDLESGDNVVIETKDKFYVYTVEKHEIVEDTQLDVTAPVPRAAGAEPGDDDYWLTLFTCHPLWDNYERYVVYSNLTATYDRNPEGELPEEALQS
ncbi:class E sortase [Salininema proteolyticum]|uniref:Class E sortase n=1 Tax=Salininema proteolyticum TaxID=1607685 RepID=A0ABV8U212_9ACTN